jgi:hypothetical protein
MSNETFCNKFDDSHTNLNSNYDSDDNNNSDDSIHEGQRDSADNAGGNGAFDCQRECLKGVDEC